MSYIVSLEEDAEFLKNIEELENIESAVQEVSTACDCDVLVTHEALISAYKKIGSDYTPELSTEAIKLPKLGHIINKQNVSKFLVTSFYKAKNITRKLANFISKANANISLTFSAYKEQADDLLSKANSMPDIDAKLDSSISNKIIDKLGFYLLENNSIPSAIEDMIEFRRNSIFKEEAYREFDKVFNLFLKELSLPQPDPEKLTGIIEPSNLAKKLESVTSSTVIKNKLPSYFNIPKKDDYLINTVYFPIRYTSGTMRFLEYKSGAARLDAFKLNKYPIVKDRLSKFKDHIDALDRDDIIDILKHIGTSENSAKYILSFSTEIVKNIESSINEIEKKSLLDSTVSMKSNLLQYILGLMRMSVVIYGNEYLKFSGDLNKIILMLARYSIEARADEKKKQDKSEKDSKPGLLDKVKGLLKDNDNEYNY